MWNCDETAVAIDPDRKKVIAPKGMKDVVFIKRCSAKMKVTAMATISANGDVLLPFLVLPYSRRLDWMDKQVKCPFALSPSGWMRRNVFLQYLEYQFLPKLKELNVTFPVILFIDGASSHIGIEISGAFFSSKWKFSSKITFASILRLLFSQWHHFMSPTCKCHAHIAARRCLFLQVIQRKVEKRISEIRQPNTKYNTESGLQIYSSLERRYQ